MLWLVQENVISNVCKSRRMQEAAPFVLLAMQRAIVDWTVEQDVLLQQVLHRLSDVLFMLQGSILIPNEQKPYVQN